MADITKHESEEIPSVKEIDADSLSADSNLLAKQEKRQEALNYEIAGIKCEVNEDDLRKIFDQLGYQPPNLIRVAARNDLGSPTVLQLYPLRSFENAWKAKNRTTMEPFPTIYWLSCPDLKNEISILEGEGWVLKLQDRILNNQSNLEQFQASHRHYNDVRWNMLHSRDREIVQKRGLVKALRNVGIAGIRDFKKVKCLHTHYAHFLAQGANLVGQWVHELLLEYRQKRK